MSSPLVLGIDLGTTSTTAVVFDPERGVLGRGEAGYPTATPLPGQAEQDPLHWRAAVAEAVRQACAAAGSGIVSGSAVVSGSGSAVGSGIGAVAVSGAGAALVLLGRDGDPVRPALIHLDQRAAAEAESLGAGRVGACVAAASGNVVGAWNVAAKLAWVRRHEPGHFAAASLVTSVPGSVLTWLTGEPAQSASDAGISDLFDRPSRRWSAQVCAALDVDPAVLPRIYEATEVVGGLTTAAASLLGLRPDTPVIAGAEDTPSAALAAGVLAAGDAYLSLGTAGVVGVAMPRGAAGDPRLLAFPHATPDLDLLSGSMTSAGAALAWWSAVTGVAPDVLVAEAERVPPGSAGALFLPYLSGELHPVNDPHARGIFAGLSLRTGRPELTRAILEGSAAATAHNLSVAAEAGARPVRLNATGRPTRSTVWIQSIADATGCPVEVVAEEGAALGDALIAAAATGAGTLSDLAATHRTVLRRHDPDPAQLAPATARRAATTSLYEASRARR